MRLRGNRCRLSPRSALNCGKTARSGAGARRFGGAPARFRPLRFDNAISSPGPWGSHVMRSLAACLFAFGVAAALPATAQTKWDMPTAYPANNFHTENIQQFVNDIDKATGGNLKITVHANASLFKAPEIKRAVQGNQAQIGEILLVNYENEDPFYGVDGIPFLATSYADSMKLYRASRKALEDRLAKQGMTLLFAVPWPPQGIYSKKELK